MKGDCPSARVLRGRRMPRLTRTAALRGIRKRMRSRSARGSAITDVSDLLNRHHVSGRVDDAVCPSAFGFENDLERLCVDLGRTDGQDCRTVDAQLRGSRGGTSQLEIGRSRLPGITDSVRFRLVRRAASNLRYSQSHSEHHHAIAVRRHPRARIVSPDTGSVHLRSNSLVE